MTAAPPGAEAARPPRRLRIGVVVQRYGLEVNGGAELHARWIVQRLHAYHEVEVLTSRAKDYTRWDRHYAAGTEEVDGVPVHRFDHPERGQAGPARVPRRHRARYALRHLLSRLQRVRVARPNGHPALDGETFIERQGPCCPDLVAHLQVPGRYDVVVFFTALFYPTAIGLPMAAAPAILVPTLHDERPMYLPLFHRVFRKPAWVLWNCEAEYRLAKRLYGSDIALGEVCGVGIRTGNPAPADVLAARARFGVEGDYFIYVGRVARAKGFDALVAAFLAFCGHDARDCKLVVVGQDFMAALPQSERLIYTGFVSEAERDALVAGATACVVTSKRESLSLVTLESMALGTPVLVNGASDVLRSHVEESGAGIAYGPGRSLRTALRQMAQLGAEERARMASAGVAYVQSRYTWGHVDAVLNAALRRICP